MKRALLAAAVAVAIFAGVFGLAASLDVSSTTLGADSAAVAACQTETISVTYAPTYQTGGYEATTVTLDGLEAGCLSKSFKVTLSDGADDSLGEYTGSTPASGTTASVTATGVGAAAVENIHVTIYG